MVPRTYPKALAERAARHLTEARAVQSADPTRVARVLETAFQDEFFLEESLREEAQALLDANKALLRGGNADLHVLREKLMAKLARERGRVLR